MSKARASLILICPGLLGPVPMVPRPPVKTPTLDAWLSGAKPSDDGCQDPFAACLAAFGLPADPETALPTGPLALLGEDQVAPPTGYWLHADPVHLRPDRDQLLVIAGSVLQPTRAEADALVAAFNEHFGDEGLRLLAPTPRRWYLSASRPPRARTIPLYRAVGRSMGAHLPEGEDAGDWTRLMNEAQMLFYGHEVNLQREARREPMINAIWTWGGGTLPSVSGLPVELAIGDSVLVRGLARLAGAAHCELGAPWGPGLATHHRSVALFDPLWTSLLERDLDAWTVALEALEGQAAALDHLVRRGLLEVWLEPCEGQRLRVASGAWRLWRRRGLADRLLVGAGPQGDGD